MTGIQTLFDWKDFLPMRLKRCSFALFALILVLSSGAHDASGQVVPAAYGRQFTLTAGGIGSVFQPDYAGTGVPAASPNRLFGVGAYVDMRFRRWFQVEAEGRWMRFNEYLDIDQSNYLIGPRIPFDRLRFWKATPYAKVLVGLGKMNFEYNDAYGRFTDIAYGGGLDIQLTRKLSFRPIDFEYQQWPDWLNTSLHPYGFSAGFGYRILGK